MTDFTNENVKQSHTVAKLSKLEWFGLISGIFGLITNIISLIGFFKSFQNPQVFISENSQFSPFILWLIVLFGILYTIFIFSYFLHRIKINNIRIARKTSRGFIYGFENNYGREKKIKEVILLMTLLLGVPLILIHFSLLYFIGRESILSMDSVTLKHFLGETDSTSALFRFGTAIGFFGIGLSLPLVTLMNFIAKNVYSAFRK